MFLCRSNILPVVLFCVCALWVPIFLSHVLFPSWVNTIQTSWLCGLTLSIVCKPCRVPSAFLTVNVKGASVSPSPQRTSLQAKTGCVYVSRATLSCFSPNRKRAPFLCVFIAYFEFSVIFYYVYLVLICMKFYGVLCLSLLLCFLIDLL